MRYAVICSLGMMVWLAGIPALAMEEHSGHEGHDGERLFVHGHFFGHFDGVTAAPDEEQRITDLYVHGHVDWGILWQKDKHRFSVVGEFFLDGEPQGHSHGHGEEEATETHHDDDGDEEGHEDEDEHGHEQRAERNRFFQDHPLLVETLTLNYDYDAFKLYLGKFAPTVGFLPSRFVGAYGYLPVHEYEIRDRIGIGGKVSHDAHHLGRHDVEVSSFFADTTLLSDSVLYRRGHRSLADGGPANTEDLSSFAVSVGGEDVLHRLGYRFGYSKQAKAERDSHAKDEETVSLSLDYGHRFSRAVKGHIVFEYADIDSFNGVADNNRSYATTAVHVYDGRWLYVVQYAHTNTNMGNNEGTFQMSAGYKLSKSLRAHLGYQQIRDDENRTSKRIGGTLEYKFDFAH